MNQEPQDITATEIQRRMKDPTTPANQAWGRLVAIWLEPELDKLIAMLRDEGLIK